MFKQSGCFSLELYIPYVLLCLLAHLRSAMITTVDKTSVNTSPAMIKDTWAGGKSLGLGGKLWIRIRNKSEQKVVCVS